MSLADLLEHTSLSAADLDMRCTKEDLDDLSLVVPSWTTLAPFLKLSEPEIEDIDSDNSKSRVKTHKMLLKWKQKYGFKATFRVLVDVFLLKLGDADMAESVCEQLKSKLVDVKLFYSTAPLYFNQHHSIRHVYSLHATHPPLEKLLLYCRQ